MNTVHKISLTCKETLQAHSMQEEGFLPFFLRLRVMLHYISCPPCRRFIKQYKFILKRIHAYRESTSATPLHQLDPEKKNQLQEQINKLT
jgi:hypothetical protein